MIPLYLFSADTIYENIAIDEAMFLLGRQAPQPQIRVWEQKLPAIVLGRSQKPSVELNLPICQENKIPISRRCSAGGTVVQAEGSINFVFHFPISWNPILTDVRKSFQFFAEYIQQALALHNIPTGYRLLSDITDGQDRKISGNAQSRSQHSILHHGTILTKPCHSLMEKYLAKPSVEPDYRQQRKHQQFVTSLQEMGFNFDLRLLAESLIAIMPQSEIHTTIPLVIAQKANELVKQKHLLNTWILEGKLQNDNCA
jgi:lipoate-protein ligase A